MSVATGTPAHRLSDPARLDFAMSRLPVVDEKIVIELRRQAELLARWEMDTRDRLTIDALVELGWTPPKK